MPPYLLEQCSGLARLEHVLPVVAARPVRG